MSSEYQYSPISTRGGIRVLDLSPGDFEDPISCRIRHISIEESEHEFKAISYAWGNDPTRSQYIYVNNNKDHLKVTLSCYNMLRWLRNEEMTRTMWIDTICINQDDDAEKSLQVREMGKIYAAAEPTLIYLGEHTPGSDTLFRHLHEAHRKLNSKESTDTPLSKPRKKIVDEVEHLFERAWFSRIWVIQELRNSPLPYFVCGRDVVYAPTLVDCHYGYSRNLPIPIFSPAPIKIYTIPFKRLLGECKTPAQKMYLLATETGLCKSTNPKDRIFALAPLIKNQPAELINLIDYSLDVDEVFRRFALFLLPDTGLALLRMVQHPRSEGLLPSWVPDWARTRERSPYDNLVTQFFEYYGSRQSYRHFYTKSVNKPMDQLIVRGIRYGYIEELGPLLHTGEGNSMSKIKAASDLIHTLGMLRKGIKVPDWPDSIMQGKSSMRKTLLLNANMPSCSTYKTRGYIRFIERQRFTSCKLQMNIYMSNKLSLLTTKYRND